MDYSVNPTALMHDRAGLWLARFMRPPPFVRLSTALNGSVKSFASEGDGVPGHLAGAVSFGEAVGI
jgi:hypothetical protein